MQRLIPQIDTVYVSEPYGFNQLMTKQFRDYKYKKSGILLDSGIKKITRYAKDYTIGNSMFTLLAVCIGRSDKTVEKKLDEVAESIKTNNKLKALVGVASMTPASLGVQI